MKITLMAALACVLLGGCGGDTPDAPRTEINAPVNRAGDSGRQAPTVGNRAVDEAAAVTSGARDALDRANRAAQELEDAARERAQRAAQAARQARIDAETRAREELARLEREREVKGEVAREIRLGADET